MKKNKHIGPRFDELLKEEGTLEAAELAAIKKVIAEQVAKEMKRNKIFQYMSLILIIFGNTIFPMICFREAKKTEINAEIFKNLPTLETQRLFQYNRMIFQISMSFYLMKKLQNGCF